MVKIKGGWEGFVTVSCTLRLELLLFLVELTAHSYKYYVYTTVLNFTTTERYDRSIGRMNAES